MTMQIASVNAFVAGQSVHIDEGHHSQASSAMLCNKKSSALTPAGISLTWRDRDANTVWDNAAGLEVM